MASPAPAPASLLVAVLTLVAAASGMSWQVTIPNQQVVAAAAPGVDIPAVAALQPVQMLLERLQSGVRGVESEQQQRAAESAQLQRQVDTLREEVRRGDVAVRRMGRLIWVMAAIAAQQPVFPTEGPSRMQPYPSASASLTNLDELRLPAVHQMLRLQRPAELQQELQRLMLEYQDQPASASASAKTQPAAVTEERRDPFIAKVGEASTVPLTQQQVLTQVREAQAAAIRARIDAGGKA